MDPATWVALGSGVGGSVTALFGLLKASRSERDQLGVQHLQMALDTQQGLIDTAQERATAQDVKIERQSARIDEQYAEIRSLRGEVASCEATKVQQQGQIHSQKVRIESLERQVARLADESSFGPE
jgi:hypothetical protein